MTNFKQKTFSRIVTILLIISAIFFLISTITYQKNIQATITIYKYNLQARDIGFRMLTASNYLTDCTRAFVVTGNITHAVEYWKEVNIDKNREHSIEALEKAGASIDDIELIKISKKYSDELCEIEQYAMMLIASANHYLDKTVPEEIQSSKLSKKDKALSDKEKLEKAKEMIFGESYALSKLAIVNAIDYFRDKVNKKADLMIDQVEKKMNRAALFLMGIVLLWTIGTITILLLYQALVTNPIVTYYEYLTSPINSMISLVPDGTIEVQKLAEAVNQRSTELQDLLSALKDSEERLQIHLNKTPLGVIDLDPEGIITRWNTAATNIFGYSEKEAIGYRVSDLIIPADNRGNFINSLKNIGTSNIVDSSIYTNINKNGNEIICEWYNTPIYSNSKFSGWASIIRDITEEKLRTDRMLYLSTNDVLTGVRNRRFLQEKIDEEHQRYLRTGDKYSILMIDVDHFKIFNDTYGHECGDIVLASIATCISNTIRETDVVGRWGGEEFVVLLPNTTTKGGADVAEKIRKKIEDSQFQYNGDHFNVTITVGVTSVKDGISSKTCIRYSDMALLAGKAKGRNTVVVDES